MKQLTMLVTDGWANNLIGIVSSYKIFSLANEHWEKQGKRPVFKSKVFREVFKKVTGLQ